MRDVLRLVGDVDLLQNCNGRSTIAQADDLLSVSFDMVVSGCLSDMTSCPVEWQPSEAAFKATSSPGFPVPGPGRIGKRGFRPRFPAK
jgi:hypothetical protein